MTAGQQAHNDAIDDFPVADDDLGNFLFDLSELLLERDNLLIDGSAHLFMNAPTSYERSYFLAGGRMAWK